MYPLIKKYIYLDQGAYLNRFIYPDREHSRTGVEGVEKGAYLQGVPYKL